MMDTGIECGIQGLYWGVWGLTVESHEVEEIFTRLASRMRSYHTRNEECGLSAVAAIAFSNSVIYDAGSFGDVSND